MAEFWDFEVYYAAAVAMHRDLSPYSVEVISSLRNEFSLSQRNLVFPYPPLLLLLIYPLGFLSYQSALFVWLTFSLLLFLSAAALVWRVGSSKHRFAGWGWLAFMLTVPPYSVLQFGQLCAPLVLGVALLFSGMQQRRSLSVAGGLLLMTFKHLLFYPLAPLVAFWMVRERRWAMPLWYLLGLGVTFAIAEFLAPGCTVAWLSFRDAALQILIESENGTLADALQRFMLQQTGELPLWPLWVAPLIGGVITSGYIFRFLRTNPDYLRHIGFLLAISLSFAPYGWFFDYAVLSLVQVVWLQQLLDSPDYAAVPVSRKIVVASMIVAAQLALFIYLGTGVSSLGAFWWYPVVMVGGGWMVLRLCSGSRSELRMS